jgi:hypothetical protein
VIRQGRSLALDTSGRPILIRPAKPEQETWANRPNSRDEREKCLTSVPGAVGGRDLEIRTEPWKLDLGGGKRWSAAAWDHGFTDSDHYMLQHDYVPIEGRGSSVADAEWCGVDRASDGAFARDPRRDRSAIRRSTWAGISCQVGRPVSRLVISVTSECRMQNVAEIP